jgi:hypothetical protein
MRYSGHWRKIVKGKSIKTRWVEDARTGIIFRTFARLEIVMHSPNSNQNVGGDHQ